MDNKSIEKISEVGGKALNRLNKENVRLWILVAALIAMVAASFSYNFYCTVKMNEKLQEINQKVESISTETYEAIIAAFDNISGSYTEETTTTVTQDSGEGDGNNVFQAGENAQYTERSDE